MKQSFRRAARTASPALRPDCRGTIGWAGWVSPGARQSPGASGCWIAAGTLISEVALLRPFRGVQDVAARCRWIRLYPARVRPVSSSPAAQSRLDPGEIASGRGRDFYQVRVAAEARAGLSASIAGSFARAAVAFRRYCHEPSSPPTCPGRPGPAGIGGPRCCRGEGAERRAGRRRPGSGSGRQRPGRCGPGGWNPWRSCRCSRPGSGCAPGGRPAAAGRSAARRPCRDRDHAGRRCAAAGNLPRSRPIVAGAAGAALADADGCPELRRIREVTHHGSSSRQPGQPLTPSAAGTAEMYQSVPRRLRRAPSRIGPHRRRHCGRAPFSAPGRYHWPAAR